MCKRIQVGWIILILMMTSLTITACVRPHPDSQVNADEPTIVPLVPQPDFITQVPPSTPGTNSSIVEPTLPPPPTVEAIEPTAEPETEKSYIVLAGDTLFKIALDHDISVEDIAEANGIIDVNSLEIGQKLVIPAAGTTGDVEPVEVEPVEIEQEPTDETDADTETDSPEPDPGPATPASPSGGVHVVRPGDNLYRIGLQYGCSVEQLSSHNGITNPNRISVGMEIQIPDCN